jgi:two-component system nitrogen regulation response regulator GlnG
MVPQPAENETTSLSMLTVLLVDDDPDWRQTLKAGLEREGFRVVALGRAEWLLPAIDLHQPDVVILDVHLPGTSGLDLLGTIGRRWPALFTIVTTAFGGSSVEDVARRRGASAYLDKPFRVSTLLDEIRRVPHPNRE